MDIECNPYHDEESSDFSILCSLRTLPDEDPNISISWFHNNYDQRITSRIDASMAASNEGGNIFKSTLSFSSPNPVNDSGDYFCQAAVDGRALLPSDSFTLTDNSNEEYDNEGPCTSHSTVCKSETKCADVPVTQAPATAFSTALPTTTAPPVTMQLITPSQTTPTPAVSDLLGLDTSSTASEVNTPSVTQQGMMTTGPSTPDNRVMSDDLQVWIYVLVGVATVFGMIIVILTIMCVGLCLRRSRSVDSETLKRELTLP